MNRRDTAMNLVMFYTPTGRLEAAWRSPTCPTEELWGPGLPVWFAQQAEAAKFDAIFLADVLYARMGSAFGSSPFSTGYEPFMTLSTMAANTRHIGLIGTASTSFYHPFNMARYLTSLDWISGGRAGWNVVTSEAGQEHYGIELPPHEERYVRADEYLRAAKALWDSWDDDAVVNDRAGATWARADRIHPVVFEGEYFRTAGQLFMHRSPQGRPVLVQAGQSPAGRDFAARHAEVIFTAQSDLGAAQEFYADLKSRAISHGRAPESIRILPGLAPIVAETPAGARAIEDELAGYIDLDAARRKLGVAVQADLTGLDLDAPIPPGLLVDPDRSDTSALGGSRYRNFYLMAVRDQLTVRRMITLNELSLGHGTASGTVADVSDQMEEWYQTRACDGFAITPVSVPEGLEAVCHQLVPELRRRGLARTEYDGLTLRANLGLTRPAPARAVADAG